MPWLSKVLNLHFLLSCQHLLPASIFCKMHTHIQLLQKPPYNTRTHTYCGAVVLSFSSYAFAELSIIVHYIMHYITTLAKKIVTAEIFMRLIRSAIMWYLATSTSICNASSRHAATASRVAVEPKLDIAQYHMIGPSINLMNFSAVTIFLARVVLYYIISSYYVKRHSYTM